MVCKNLCVIIEEIGVSDSCGFMVMVMIMITIMMMTMIVINDIVHLN